jgi:hypothetical protein
VADAMIEAEFMTGFDLRVYPESKPRVACLSQVFGVLRMFHFWIGFVSLMVGIGLGQLVLKESRAILAGFATIGLWFGLVLGLSTSPIIGSTMTAGFAIAGTLIQSYLASRAPGPGGIALSPPSGRWLLPFAALTVAGMIVGIMIRTNDSFYFGEPNIKKDYIAKGFTPEQADTIMASLVKNIQADKTAGQAGTEAKALVRHGSNLQAAQLEAEVGLYLPIVMGMQNKTPREKLDALKQRVSPEASAEIEGWESNGLDPETILKTLSKTKR